MIRTYSTARGSQLVLYGMLLMVGFLLLYLSTAHFSVIPKNEISPNEFSAFLLGCFITVLSTVALIAFPTKKVTIDGLAKKFFIQETAFGRTKMKTIDFATVEKVGLSVFGIETGSRIYDVVLTLIDGEKVQLFFSTYTRGAFVRSEMERRKREIEEILGVYGRSLSKDEVDTILLRK
ncbi:hypothetical protein GW937_01905 [Candidatus Kaiserbacteria bacterium]|nr:hypothetical protein [Candidatus Kaiserbacteria bacterium]